MCFTNELAVLKSLRRKKYGKASLKQKTKQNKTRYNIIRYNSDSQWNDNLSEAYGAWVFMYLVRSLIIKMGTRKDFVKTNSKHLYKCFDG